MIEENVTSVKVGDVERIVVVGAGDMGHGIAEACAISGYEVFLRDIKQDILDAAMDRIQDSLKVLARKRKVKGDELNQILGRIHPTTDLGEAAGGAHIAIEAVPEVLALKEGVLGELDASLPPGAILATNTSNMSITRLASSTRNPGRVAGLHFFNPAILMKTVEVIRGEQTATETTSTLSEFVRSLGKIPIPVVKDTPGFVVNRVQAPAQVLVTRAVQRGIFTPNQLDAVARRMSMPMGPFETMDYVGLDVVVHGMNYFGETLGDDYLPPEWLVELFEAGKLGKKTGVGIFDWSSGRPEIDLSDPTEEINMLDLLAVQVNEATKLVEGEVVQDPGDIDLAIKNGTGNAMGVLSLLKSIGKEKIVGICERWADELGVGIFRPTNSLLGWD
ncbi:MAG: 3-hydroxyacyl-CoA dehydrogenase NAD-binding domain-containing protein [Promethearchaeota archaeon]